MFLPGFLPAPGDPPQSLLSILVFPAVAALAAYPVERLWAAGRATAWPVVRACALPATLVILAVIAYINVEFYFGDQANDPRAFAEFSTDETLMARSHTELQRRGYSIWTSRQYLFGAIGEVLGSNPKREVIKSPDTLPLDSTQVWHGAAIYFEPRERGFWELTRAYYPDGEFHAVTPPMGGEPLFYTAFVSREQLVMGQGLDVAYTLWNQPIGAKPQPIRISAWHTLDGPEEYPYDLNITGALKVDNEGEYEFQLDSSLDVYVELDGIRILGPMKPRSRVVPAVGMHSLKIVGRVSEPDKSGRLLWRPPGGEFEPIPYSHLYRGTVRPLGAVGRFFTGGDESVLPDAVEIAPSMDVFNYFPVVDEPHTVAWEGILKVEKLGDHKFAVERVSGPVKFYFENDLLAQDPPTEDVDREGEVLIGSGSYPIRVEYEARDRGRSTMFKILWQPPGENMTPIPVEALTPAREHILRVIE
ncbi:MAG: PA14 domain-containing protein, partial [Dehalococcoidia bacterium]|nr:PA14 domain-containing protein [Dehalococcoidia bacterium]